jgi:hypothetical protein
MIARIWHGVTAAAKANECVEYLKVSELSDYAKTDGNRGVYLLRRVAGNEAFSYLDVLGFRTVLQQFGAEDIERERYYPKDAEFLLKFEPLLVKHDEVVVAA